MISWSAIDTVLLDMDGTLLDLYFDNYFWQEFIPEVYAQKNGLSYRQANDLLMGKYQAVYGDMNWYCVDYWTEQLSLDIQALKHEVSHYIAVHSHAEEFLQRLYVSDKQIWLVTNAHHKSLDIKIEKTGIGKYFDEIVCSHDYQSPKETQEFWKALNDSKPFDAARTLLVEDSLPVLRSAQRYGIGHLLAITKPDSRKSVNDIEEFPAVENFEVINAGLW